MEWIKRAEIPNPNVEVNFSGIGCHLIRNLSLGLNLSLIHFRTRQFKLNILPIFINIFRSEHQDPKTSSTLKIPVRP